MYPFPEYLIQRDKYPQSKIKHLEAIMTILCLVAGVCMLLGCTFSVNVNKTVGANSSILQQTMSPKSELSEGVFENDQSSNNQP
jgi:hypothetical protein